MAASGDEQVVAKHPHALHGSKSFSRIPTGASEPSPTRIERASTMTRRVPPSFEWEGEGITAGSLYNPSDFDAFKEGDGGKGTDAEGDEISGKVAFDVDKLPVDLMTLSDRFIDSLSAKVHPSPPNVEKLSILFQDFYGLASNHINTYISSITSQATLQGSPSPVTSSLASTASRIRAKAASVGAKERLNNPMEGKESEQRMLTSEELAERKVARKALELKRLTLEEAIERKVCAGVYDRIWRHRSTQDEAKDEKLRSKTAALGVVGIGITDLGIDLGPEDSSSAMNVTEKEKEVREWLANARQELLKMNDERYPLGKLQHLKEAHKCIVDTLSHFHPSSSADEIMPMLIYTLITSPPEGMNVISNLNFIQRFREERKIDGEAAYCLTNLEAAITFLETVDLASLRPEEVLSGPSKSGSRPSTPRLEDLPAHSSNDTIPFPELSPASISPAALNTSQVESITPVRQISASKSLRPAMQSQNRRLSGLFQPPAQALGAAGDAMLNTADQGFKTIGDSLGSSYNFLLSKLKERQETNGRDIAIVVPKTLDEARKLVGTPALEDDGSISGASSSHSLETSGKVDDKILNLIGGRKQSRDRSVESVRSAGSGKKVAFAQDGREKSPSPLSTATSNAINPAIVESMRNLGSTLNPMNRIAGMGMMRNFGRNAEPSPAETPSESKVQDASVTGVTSSPGQAVVKIAPPVKRFMEVRNPGELRLNEVIELLRDYRRLAGALKDMGAV